MVNGRARKRELFKSPTVFSTLHPNQEHQLPRQSADSIEIIFESWDFFLRNSSSSIKPMILDISTIAAHSIAEPRAIE